MISIAIRSKYRIIFLLVLFFCQQLYAQDPLAIEEAKKTFPGANNIQLLNSEVLTIKVNGDKLNVVKELYQQHYIINSLQYSAERKISYTPGYIEIADLKASTSIYNKGKWQKIPVTEFEDTEQLSDQVFYDDTKFKRFFFKGIQNESITEVNYSINFVVPEIISAFYFSIFNMPLLKTEYKVIVPNNVEIDYNLFGDTTGVVFSLTNEKNQKVYCWQLNKAKELKNYNGLFSYRYVEPHVIVRIKEFKTKKGTVTVLKDLNDLYRYKYKFIKDLNKAPVCADLKNVCDSIKTISSNKEDLLRNVYYWVKDNVRYIAIEDGAGGFVPREANDIFYKKYGDCKDYSSIIKHMLDYLGVQSYLAWVGSNELPYKYSLNTPNVSNHMIVAVPINNDYYFVDGTSYNTAYDLPSGFIQGKETLIAKSETEFEVRLIPYIKPERNLIQIYNTIQLLNDDKIIANAKLKSNGLMRSDNLDKVYHRSKIDRDLYFKNYLSSGNNKCKVNSFEILNERERDSTLKFNYNFEIENYVKKIESNLYVNLNFNKIYPALKIDTAENRKVGFYLDQYLNVEESFDLEIPANAMVKKIPESLIIDNDYFNFISKYELKNNRVIHFIKFKTKVVLVNKEQFNEWNTLVDKLNNHTKQLVVLQKK